MTQLKPDLQSLVTNDDWGKTMDLSCRRRVWNVFALIVVMPSFTMTSVTSNGTFFVLITSNCCESVGYHDACCFDVETTVLYCSQSDAFIVGALVSMFLCFYVSMMVLVPGTWYGTWYYDGMMITTNHPPPTKRRVHWKSHKQTLHIVAVFKPKKTARGGHSSSLIQQLWYSYSAVWYGWYNRTVWISYSLDEKK